MLLYIIAGLAIAAALISIALWRRVPVDMVDVVAGNDMRSYSGNTENATTGKSGFMKIPAWVPFLGMQVQTILLNMIPIGIPDFLAFDKDRVRFLADIACYVTVAGKEGAIRAATRFPEGDLKAEVEKQLRPVIQESVRDTTTKLTIHEIINQREQISEITAKAVAQVLPKWGMKLEKLALINLKDPKREYDPNNNLISSSAIEDISSIREIEIRSESRQKNAQRLKDARMKEAIEDQAAQEKEIERDKKVGVWKQTKEQEIFKKQQEAKEEEMKVRKVQTVRQAEIDKEKKIIDAEATKKKVVIDAEAEKDKRKIEAEGFKQKEELEGQGIGRRRQLEGEGEAAAIKAKGFAEAEAKEKLQAALNKFKPEAIRALIAEDVVAMQKDVGLQAAEALKNADLRIFSGSEGKTGFDLGQMLTAMMVSNEGLAKSTFNKLARPNDLGFQELPEKAPAKKK